MSISASDVMELRRRTGAGMMECKKFLIAAEGDMEKAITEMRKSGQAKADKKASRTAAEGVVAIAMMPDNLRAVVVEVNSETDFVARDESFTSFTQKVAETGLAANTNDENELNQHLLVGGSDTVENERQGLVAKLGENIKVRRIHCVNNEGPIGTYVHGGRIGVIVAMKNGDEELAKGIAMHIAASKPLVVSRDQVPTEAIDNEREIFMAQALESGKPQDIIEKMVEGRITKFLDEVSLSGQAYVKDPNKKVGQLLQEQNAEVVCFIRYEVGEGIEKKEDNFVEEVMAQVRGQ